MFFHYNYTELNCTAYKELIVLPSKLVVIVDFTSYETPRSWFNGAQAFLKYILEMSSLEIRTLYFSGRVAFREESQFHSFRSSAGDVNIDNATGPKLPNLCRWSVRRRTLCGAVNSSTTRPFDDDVGFERERFLIDLCSYERKQYPVLLAEQADKALT